MKNNIGTENEQGDVRPPQLAGDLPDGFRVRRAGGD